MIGAASRVDHPPAYGYVDSIFPGRAGLTVAGWMLLPDEGLDAITWTTDGVDHVPVDVLDRPHLLRSHQFHPAPLRSGFQFLVPHELARSHPWIDIVGHSTSGGTGAIPILLRGDRDEHPVPDEHLMHRVAHTTKPDVFFAGGVRTYSDFRRHLTAAAHDLDDGALLDWGCGCGRVTRFFASDFPNLPLFGCDLDEEAVGWLAAHVDTVQSAAVGIHPPTPYEDAAFHTVLGYSVLTHLERASQRAWIEEMGRITAPGGVLIVTVHGEHALRWSYGDTAILDGHDIVDHLIDTTLAGVVPDGWYRATYQTAAYTEALLAPWFDVVEVERGGTGLQDIVVARRR